MPKRKAIQGNGNYTCLIEKIFLIREYSTHGIIKHFHAFDSQKNFIQIKIDMLFKWKLPIKDESKIVLYILGTKNETSKYAEVKQRKVKDTMWSGKVKNFNFSMLDNKSKLFK